MAALRFVAVSNDSNGEGDRSESERSEPDSERLIELAQSLTPRFEVRESEGLIVLEIGSSEEKKIVSRLSSALGPEKFRIGIASTRTAAILAARSDRTVPPGKEREFLQTFPIDALAPFHSLEDGLTRTFKSWGIYTLGQLERLPVDQLKSRLGSPGVRLQRLARGEDPEPFQAYRPEAGFEETESLEWIPDSLESLTFLLGRLLDRLCTRLESEGLSAEALQIRLDLDGGECFERSLRLAFPMRTPKVLLSLLRLDLQSHPPRGRIKAVSLSVKPTRPRVLQYSLLQSATPHPERLSRTLARLNALVGQGRLGRPVPLDTHRPDSFRLEDMAIDEPDRRRSHRKQRPDSDAPHLQYRASGDFKNRLVLRRLRPPKRIRFQERTVAASAGPWRSSGDWWGDGSESWERDEWDVEFGDGSLCRIFWDHRKECWFLDGVYD